MNPKPRISTTERFGRWLGRMWRGYLRGERWVLESLIAKSMPAWIANALVWAVKLAVLGVLLYVAFWVAVVLAFAITGAWVARNADWDEPEPEWKNGFSGYGLYRGDMRIDIGDPYGEE